MPFGLSFLNTNKTPTFYKGALKPSRFDSCGDLKKSCDELKKISGLVEKIRKQVTKLAEDKKSQQAETVAYAKLTVMSTLLQLLDADITAFNQQNEQLIVNDELKEAGTLVAKLIDIVNPLLTDSDAKKTIGTKRNNHKKLVRKATEIGFIGGAALFALSGPFLPGLAYCGIGLAASTGVKRYFKLNIDDPASYLMVKDLDEALSKAAIQIEMEMKRQNPLPIDPAAAPSISTPSH